MFLRQKSLNPARFAPRFGPTPWARCKLWRKMNHMAQALAALSSPNVLIGRDCLQGVVMQEVFDLFDIWKKLSPSAQKEALRRLLDLRENGKDHPRVVARQDLGPTPP